VLALVDLVTDQAGGAERFAVGLALALPKDRFDVTVCATREEGGRLAAELDAGGVRHFSLARRGGADPLAFRQLARFLKSERIDVLHAHKFGSNLWGTILGRLARVPVVVAHEQTWSYEGQPLRRFLDGKVIGRLANCFVSVSNADKERMVEVEGVPEEKIVTLPNAYIPRDREAVGDLRAELSLPSGAPLVGTVAQLRPQKALHVLIDAFAVVARSRPEARLLIVGEGGDKGRLEAHAAASEAADRILFPGLRTDIDTVLGALDVAAMSSDFEGLPLFVLECMAHGTPLVATRVGGIPDALEDGRSGLLVPPRDPAAMAGAIESLLADPGRRQAMAEAAQQRVADFTIDRVAARFADLYDRLLASA
jgi:glycosyltransferase involved in cell wall biosynthesis